MAFDRPLEADRVDDLGLLSSFVRAPIVGPIMWMLGGALAKQPEEEEQDDQWKIMDSSPMSDDGEIEDVGKQRRRRRMKQERCIDASTTHSTTATATATTTTRKTRKMSWSDESGSPLVQYYDESSLPLRSNTSNTPPSATSDSTCTNNGNSARNSSSYLKSAMRHSKSQYSVALNTSSKTHGQYQTSTKFHPRECVPSGLRKDLMMPSGARYFHPHPQHAAAQTGPIAPMATNGNASSSVPPATNAAANANGYISPQWGWYISTTPPTQEHYAGAMTSSKVNGNDATNDTSKSMVMPKKAPPAVLKPFYPTNSSGWPSVPL